MLFYVKIIAVVMIIVCRSSYVYRQWLGSQDTVKFRSECFCLSAKVLSPWEAWA